VARPYRRACTLLLRLLVAAILLLVVGTSQSLALSTANADATAPIASVEEEWEEEPDEWEVEDEEEEWVVEDDEGEWVVEEESEAGWEVSSGSQKGEAPASCTPYRASARVVAAPRGDTVRLEVSYASEKATGVRVDYWLKGSRGALRMRSLRRRIRRHGSLRGVERLSDREMSKVRAARSFVVDLEVRGASSCEGSHVRHLTARQRLGEHTVWTEPPRPAPGS
jgi:hypothetical protein